MIRLFYELIKLKSEHYSGKYSEIFNSKLENVFDLLKSYDFENLYWLFKHLGIYINKIKSIVKTSQNGYLKYDLCKHSLCICINNLDHFYKLCYFVMITIFYSRKDNFKDGREFLWNEREWGCESERHPYRSGRSISIYETCDHESPVHPES